MTGCGDGSRSAFTYAMACAPDDGRIGRGPSPDMSPGPSYLDRLRAGGARVDLDGVPCGAVTAEQAAMADKRRQAFNTMREAQKVR